MILKNERVIFKVLRDSGKSSLQSDIETNNRKSNSMKTAKFPKFDSYACIGDSITWHVEGYDLTATLKQDTDCSPLDFDCYSPIKIKQWKNDEWFYVGVVISIAYNGVELDAHAASLWGCDCNFNRTSNKHLSEVAKEMESEALNMGRVARENMIVKLGATV